MRRFLAVQLALLGICAAPAQAAVHGRTDAPPTSLTQTVTTAHFVVHYTTAAGDPNAIGDTTAQTLAANAEAAYASEVGQWGYAPPVDDGDGRTDIFVFRLTMYAGLEHALSGTIPTAAAIYIDPRHATNPSLIAHEFFHVLQSATYGNLDSWLLEATGRWAEHQLYPSTWGEDLDWLQHLDAPLDCDAASCPPGAWDGGYSRWLFIGYLTDLYGRDFVRQLFAYARSEYDAMHTSPKATDVLDAVLRRYGTSLSRSLAGFAVANAGRVATALPLGVSDAARVSITVDRLAAKYLELRGNGARCTTSTLNVRVTIPVGSASASLVADGTATQLDVSNGAATGTIPWSTCGSRAILVLPNGSTTGGAVPFTVQAAVGSSPAAATPQAGPDPTPRRTRPHPGPRPGGRPS